MYILNGVTIKRPQRVVKDPIEVSSTVRTIGGEEKRDITAYKNRYILTYDHISVADATTIRTIYDLKTVVTFQSTETNFTVSSRDVLVNISSRDYAYAGTDYLSDFELILTEITET